MGKLQRTIIVLLVITVLAYIFKFEFGVHDKFMTYESAITPNAIAKRFESFESFEMTNNKNNSVAHSMCLKMAGDNCRIPTYPNNGCWMTVYDRCRNTCSRDVTGDCNCSAIATRKCGTRGDPAEQCLNSVYQKCMAGRVSGVPDPDRGVPSINTGCQNF